MNDKSQVEYILNDIKAVVDNVIVKLNYQAEQYETVEIKREADRYVAAYLERDTFNSYRTYPIDVLARAGITNLNELYTYTEDRHKIPREKREAVLKAMRHTVINEYYEQNDYYRELIGKPSMDTPEEEWIYLTEEEMKYYNIDEIRPIHEYPMEIQLKLERGIIPQLIELYPEKTYLRHMGSKAVNLVRAREAKNFEIIFTDVNLDTVFMRAFFETYDFAREYFMSIIYNKSFKERYDLYDNYIGMHIMIMTIQRLVVDTIKMGIDRDFYDLISIKKLFDVYGIPFFEDLPLDYQRTIVKNVNMLIRSKSTDKVLYDIANTLFYERVKIYKYYLIRERKFDEDGDPVFVYKETVLDAPPEKFYIRGDDTLTYELAIRGDKLATVEYDVSYAPDFIYVKDSVNDDGYRLFIKNKRLHLEKVEPDNQVFENVVMYNEDEDKYKLLIEKGRLKTEYTPYRTAIEYDYEKMFNVYFQAADIMEKNVISSLDTKYNRYGYKEVVSDDTYWWETEELKKELYEREYNFIDSKYISITVMQNLTKMLYETSYYLNLLVDHKETDTLMEQRIFNSDAMKKGTDYLYINLERLTTVPVSIFDAVIILCALVSKKNSMRGNIIVKSPAQILSVLGFNFDLNFDLIRENIKKYKRTFKNQEILKYLDLLDVRTVEDIDILYNNFKNFTEFCSDVIANTTDINEYKAYKELYKVMTVRKDTTDLFTMSDGRLAETYLEYLYDKLPVVAEFISDLHKDKTGIYIEHVLGKLNELIPEIEYLNTLNGTNNNIVQAILGLINFFKSYTVDLRTLNIMYMFDNKMFNKIYMIDDPRLFIKLFPTEVLPLYNDNVKPILRFDTHDNLVIYDPSKTYITIHNNIDFNLQFVVDQWVEHFDILDNLDLDYRDIIDLFKHNDVVDSMYLRTNDDVKTRISVDDEQNIKDDLMLQFLLDKFDTLNLDYKDIIRYIINKHFINMDLISKHECALKDEYVYNAIYNFIEKFDVLDKLHLEEYLGLYYKDIIFSVDDHVKSSMDIAFNDTIKVIYEE